MAHVMKSCGTALRKTFQLNPGTKLFFQRLSTSIVMEAELHKLQVGEGHFIGYKQHTSTSKDGRPGIVFCSGLLSSLDGTKARFLHDYCVERDLSYVRFDYIGHEHSSGTMKDFSVGLWKQNTLDVVDKLTQGNLYVFNERRIHVSLSNHI